MLQVSRTVSDMLILTPEKDVTSKQECIGYADSYTGDLDKVRSTTGYVFSLS